MVTQGMSTVIVLLLALCYLHQCSSAGEYCVRPPLEHECDCPSDQLCLTLSEYIQNSTTYFTSNATFHFLSGTHTVTEASQVVIRDVHSLVFDSYGLSQQLPATVDCTRNRLMFAFVEVEDLRIEDLHFLNCGLEIPSNLSLNKNLVRNNTQAALLFVSVTSLVLENVSVRKSYGYGLLSWNSVTVKVVGCSFHCNNWRAGRMHPWVDKCADGESEDSGLEQNQLQSGGNALFICAENNFQSYLNESKSVSITSSEFAYGMSHGSQFPITDPVAGLGVHFKTRSPKIVEIQNCTFNGNKGANVFLHFDLPSSKTVLVINNCSFYNGKGVSEGGGLYIRKDVRNQGYFDASINASITNSEFIGNSAEKGSGLYLHIDITEAVTACDYFSLMRMSYRNPLEQNLCSEQYYHITINIDSCNFSNNTGLEGSGMNIGINRGAVQETHTYTVTLIVSKTVFQRNTADQNGGGICIVVRKSHIYTVDPILGLRYTTFDCNGREGAVFIDMKVVDSNFTENNAANGSALVSYIANCETKGSQKSMAYMQVYETFDIEALDNILLFHNIVYATITINNSNFTENMRTAIWAINTELYLAGQVRFVGNKGNNGGALSLIKHSLIYLDSHARVYFINNTALQYGGAIEVTIDSLTYIWDSCFIEEVIDDNSNLHAKVILINNTAVKAGDSIYGGNLDSCYSELFSLSVFEIKGKHSQSEIASKPYKVCFCPSTFTGQSCQNTSNTTVFRGQTFTDIAIIGSGQYGYASPTVIHVSVLANYTGELGERQSVQEVGRRCTNITLSIRTPEELTKLELSVDSSSIPIASVPAVLTVSFLPCPFGFDLTGDPPKCDCVDHLRKPGVNCSIDSQLVHRPATVWIGNYSNDVVIHSHCPFDYCKTEDNEISLHQQDEQCSLNHARVLCGACQPGLSLALGSSRCMQCSNVWILLFVPFTVAGVALVILLLKCNLTVSTGTINGLIFYANIIKVNHTIFFPPGKINPATQTLAVFIAWVNLDLGIETCLFEGMTAFIKTWLQFLFPIYIWVMVGLMIIVSRYSTTVSRLTGYNTVSVLATLFLLSYAKLLRTITTTLSFTTLSDRNGHTSAVWLLDGNVGFLKGPHIALFIGSLLALLGFVLPFALLVLLAPFLQASTHYHVQKLVNKFKPLLDAYQGPHKDKFRLWTGFMLWVRIVLFTAFASNALGDPQVNLFVIILSVLFLFVILLKTGGVYKNSIIEMVEWFFLLNLGTFAASTQFLRSLESFSVKRQEIVTDIMVGSAFSVFLGILAYHCYGYLKKAGVVDWMRVHFIPRPVLQQYAHPDNADDEENNGSGAQAQDTQPTFTEIRLDELRESLMSDN